MASITTIARQTLAVAACLVAFVGLNCEPGETASAESGILVSDFESDSVLSYKFLVTVDGPEAEAETGAVRVRVDSISVPEGEQVLIGIDCGDQPESGAEEALPRDPPKPPIGDTRVIVSIREVPVEYTCIVTLEFTGVPEAGVLVEWELWASVKTNILGGCGRDLVDVTIEQLGE